MPLCEEAIPTSAHELVPGGGDLFDVVAFGASAFTLYVAVPLLAWTTRRTDWAPRWAARFARLARSGTLDVPLVAVLVVSVVVTHMRSPARPGACFPPYVAALGGGLSCLGVWLYAWLLHRARDAAPPVYHLGVRSRPLSVTYAYVGLICQGTAALYFALVCGLFAPLPLVSVFGPLMYWTQLPVQLAPLVLLFVELGSARRRPVAWPAVRATSYALIVIWVGYVYVGIDWPLSRVAEALAVGAAIAFGAPMVEEISPSVQGSGGSSYAPRTHD